MDQLVDHTTVELASLSDEYLIALVVQHHEAALGTLYDRHGPLAYAIAMRITGNRQTAEEVVQDVFQNVWRTATGFRPETASVSAWLVGIARHRAIDATRTRRERSRTREQPIDQQVIASTQAGPESVVLRTVVRDALAALPPNQREALELAYYGGFTRAEIADRLGQPVGTVKTRLRLGLVKLRDILNTVVEQE